MVDNLFDPLLFARRRRPSQLSTGWGLGFAVRPHRRGDALGGPVGHGESAVDDELAIHLGPVVGGCQSTEFRDQFVHLGRDFGAHKGWVGAFELDGNVNGAQLWFALDGEVARDVELDGMGGHYG